MHRFECCSLPFLDGVGDRDLLYGAHLGKKQLVAQDFQLHFACVRGIESVNIITEM
jgi:hypothetical protein